MFLEAIWQLEIDWGNQMHINAKKNQIKSNQIKSDPINLIEIGNGLDFHLSTERDRDSPNISQPKHNGIRMWLNHLQQVEFEQFSWRWPCKLAKLVDTNETGLRQLKWIKLKQIDL